LTNSHGDRRPYDEMFEHALQFLANPWKLWGSERLEDKMKALQKENDRLKKIVADLELDKLILKESLDHLKPKA